MGKRCVVLNCKQSEKAKNVSFHQVPSVKKMALRQFWLKRIRRRDYIYNAKKHILVCSNHFKTSDFQSPRHLKKGAVPSIFEWNFTNGLLINNIDQNEKHIQTIVKETLSNVIESVECLNEAVEDGIDDDNTNRNVDYLHPIVKDTNGVIDVVDNDTKDSVSSCDCAKKLKEFEALIEELKLKISIQNRIIDVKDFKLRRAEKELKSMKRQETIAEKKFKDSKPSIDEIKNSDKDILFYTGLPSYAKLMTLYNRLNPGPNGENINLWKGMKEPQTTVTKSSSAGRPRKLDVKDQFLLVLMRLRLGLFLKDLADRFGVSTSTASTICITWINFMYFRLGQINIWPTREQIDESMPDEFKRDYPRTRVILDATELKCQTSKSLVLQSGTYSNYKSCNTFKGLIGISPNGYVTFVSHLFTGNISDQEITRRSGFLSLKFSPNDSVMCDKGFLIKEMLQKKGVELNMPPFLGENGQFTKAELEKTQKIAALRIHVERRIARIRGFHILDRPVPLSLAPIINQLWTVITLLSNFQTSIIKNTEKFNDSTQTIDHYDEILEPGNSTHIDDLDDFQEEILEPENEHLEDEQISAFENSDASEENEIPVVNLNSASEDEH